jgi:hypothetical protein
MASKTEAVAGVITVILPSVVQLIQSLFVQQNPGVPPPTSAEVKAYFASVCTSALLTDDNWLAQHPPK